MGAHLLRQHNFGRFRIQGFYNGNWLLAQSFEPRSLAVLEFKMFKVKKARNAVLQVGWTFHIFTSGKPYPKLTGARARADTKPLSWWNSLQLFLFTDITIPTFEWRSSKYFELKRYWCSREEHLQLLICGEGIPFRHFHQPPRPDFLIGSSWKKVGWCLARGT